MGGTTSKHSVIYDSDPIIYVYEGLKYHCPIDDGVVYIATVDLANNLPYNTANEYNKKHMVKYTRTWRKDKKGQKLNVIPFEMLELLPGMHTTHSRFFFSITHAHKENHRLTRGKTKEIFVPPVKKLTELEAKLKASGKPVPVEEPVKKQSTEALADSIVENILEIKRNNDALVRGMMGLLEQCDLSENSDVNLGDYLSLDLPTVGKTDLTVDDEPAVPDYSKQLSKDDLIPEIDKFFPANYLPVDYFLIMVNLTDKYPEDVSLRGLASRISRFGKSRGYNEDFIAIDGNNHIKSNYAGHPVYIKKTKKKYNVSLLIRYFFAEFPEHTVSLDSLLDNGIKVHDLLEGKSKMPKTPF